MINDMSRDDLDKIKADIRRKYSDVAKGPEGRFQYPTGRKGLESPNYDKTLIDRLPHVVASYYCGVGNPFSLEKSVKANTYLISAAARGWTRSWQP
jgi:hypothetical protein